MNRIAILIPTMNRPVFMGRALNFYKTIGFNGSIYIGDSSEPRHIRDWPALFPELKIKNKFYPVTKFNNQIVVLKDLMNYVTEPYSCIPGDDDFIIATNMIKLADFLDDNKDFNMAAGFQVKFFIVSKNEIFGDIKIDKILHPHDWSSTDPLERFCGYMRHGGSTTYHLHRREMMADILQYADEITIPAIGTEILLCSLAALSGKVKTFKTITSFQQSETSAVTFPRIKDKKNQIPTFFRIMTMGEWPDQFNLFKNVIVNKMVSLGSSIEEANNTFYREFVYRVILLLKEQHNRNYEEFTDRLQDYWGYQSILVKNMDISWYNMELGEISKILRLVCIEQ